MSSPSDAVHLLAELRTRRQSELVILTTQGNMSSSVEGNLQNTSLLLVHLFQVSLNKTIKVSNLQMLPVY